MSKHTIAGLVAWLFSGLLLGFQAIAAFMNMEEKMIWKSLTIADIIGNNYFNWIQGLSWAIAQNILNYIVTMPLYLLLFFVGILFFVLNRITA
jgi:hypothetical protein